jgi:large subunit ribosomal protein L33
MAKKNIVLVKLESSAGTGYFYVKKKNPKNQTGKMSFRKYDPRVRKHVVFNETKLKS